MSWSISTRGTAEEIGRAFDTARDEAAKSGMIVAEQEDIDEVRDLAMKFADEYDYVAVQAGGHWSVFGLDDPRNRFGSVHITINAIERPSAAAASADQETRA